MSNPSEVAALVAASNNLTQAVIKHRSEINNTVEAKIAQLDAWKDDLTPPSIQAEPRYLSTIDLTGLSTDRYYPVWWQPQFDGNGLIRLAIVRNYYDDLEVNPFGSGNIHIAGLFLDMEAVAGGWNGGANLLHVKRLAQLYRKTVRNLHYFMRCSSVLPVPGYPLASWATAQCRIRAGLYLRGGLTYRVISNFYQSLNYSREEGEIQIAQHANDPLNESARWFVKSYDKDDPFLGEEYEDFKTPFNAFPYDV